MTTLPPQPRRRRLPALLAAAALAVGSLAVVTTPVAAVTVDDAVPQPGVAALADGTREAVTQRIDCPAPGECVAVGSFGRSNTLAAWGAVMTGGVWNDAVELPGITAIDPAGQVTVLALSCGAPGECLAGGVVRSDPGPISGYDAFVIELTGGSWQSPVVLGGVATGVGSWVYQIDCPEPGECVIAGDAEGTFVAEMIGGTLTDPVRVPGLDPADSASEPKVSCVGVDFCVLAGYFTHLGANNLYSVTRTGGTWASPVTVPDPSGLIQANWIFPSAMDCAAVGSCTLVGEVELASGSEPAFVTEMSSGAFGAITLLPTSAELAVSPFVLPNAIDCPGVGACVLGGIYYEDDWDPRPLVGMQTGGAWGPLMQPSGVVDVTVGGVEPMVTAVSCSAVGACALVGMMRPGTPETTAFVILVDAGVMGGVEPIPELATLQTGPRARAYTVACTADGACAGGGGYRTTGSVWDSAFTFGVTGLEPAPLPPTPDPDPVPEPTFTG